MIELFQTNSGLCCDAFMIRGELTLRFDFVLTSPAAFELNDTLSIKFGAACDVTAGACSCDVNFRCRLIARRSCSVWLSLEAECESGSDVTSPFTALNDVSTKKSSFDWRKWAGTWCMRVGRLREAKLYGLGCSSCGAACGRWCRSCCCC